jgi:hypothetical protein
MNKGYRVEYEEYPTDYKDRMIFIAETWDEDGALFSNTFNTREEAIDYLIDMNWWRGAEVVNKLRHKLSTKGHCELKENKKIISFGIYNDLAENYFAFLGE